MIGDMIATDVAAAQGVGAQSILMMTGAPTA
jgi:ribonucleotide monophosphatase NagD (HAD superfamily)